MPKHRLALPTEYRILVIGENGVGKTSLIARYVHNQFPCRLSNSNPTVYSTVIDGNDCTIIFVDISSVHDLSQLKKSSSVPTACFLMFAITDQESFLRLNHLRENLHLTCAELSRSMPMLILANKIDLEPERAVSQESIDKFQSYGFHVFEISVKGNVGIGDAVYTAIKQLQHDQCEPLRPNSACTCLIT